MRTQAIVARQRAATTEDLYRFSRKLAGIATLDDLLWATAYQMAHMLKLHVVLLMPEGEELDVRAGYPPEDTLEDSDLAAAKWTFQHGQEAGCGADTLPGKTAGHLADSPFQFAIADAPIAADQRFLVRIARRMSGEDDLQAHRLSFNHLERRIDEIVGDPVPRHFDARADLDLRRIGVDDVGDKTRAFIEFDGRRR